MGNDGKALDDSVDQFDVANAPSWVLAHFFTRVINILKLSAPDASVAAPSSLVYASNDNRCPSSSDEKSFCLDATESSVPLSWDGR
jgi:hypothetical protein